MSNTTNVALRSLFLSMLGLLGSCEHDGRTKRAPFRVLYSNDSTNLISCTSPFHKRGEAFRPEMLEASIDEAVGSDAYLLQPATCWVPWWKSTAYPADEHYRWLKEDLGLRIDSVGEWLIQGGDLVQVFVDHCRKRGIAPFVSMRMNDYHGNEHLDILTELMNGAKPPKRYTFGITHRGSRSRFLLEHPEYRIAPDPEAYHKCEDRLAFIRDKRKRYGLRPARVLNWAIPEVREHRFTFIKEICEGYDIDGFEMDFMRHFRYFRPEETTSEQRVKIMTDFVGRVRRLLDRTAKPGQHRRLCVRVPFRLAAHDELGIDLRRWVDAGVDMINLSCHYITAQQCDVAEVCRVVPETAVYLELTYANLRHVEHKQDRKMAEEQFYTAAHLAYARGASGVSLFNFAYYRQIATKPAEPPFHVIARLGGPAWLARQPQHYFMTGSSNSPAVLNPPFPKAWLRPGKTLVFPMDMAPPTGGWRTNGRLRVQGREALGSSEIAATLNGVELASTADVSEPYATPHLDGLGAPETLRAWIAPHGLLKDGINRIEVRMGKGEPVRLVFLDLAI